MRLLRLSLLNMKKHKFESISTILLLFICMTLLGSAISGFPAINNIYKNVKEKTGRVNNLLFCNEDKYHDKYEEILKEDERVTMVRIANAIYSPQAAYLDGDGKEKSLSTVIMTAREEAKLENIDPVISFEQDVLDKYEHPIYAPFYVMDSMGMKVGDTYNMVFEGNVYPFTIAGFYETGVFSDGTFGVKFIVSDRDFKLVSAVMNKTVFIGYNLEDDVEEMTYIQELIEKYEDKVGKDVMYLNGFPLQIMEIQSMVSVDMILGVMMIMAIVILVATMIVMGFRIRNDISQQIINIGVLEALGYTMPEIIKTYVYEYMIIGAIGSLGGIIAACIVSPVILNIGQVLTGHHGELHVYYALIIAVAIVLTGIICLIAYERAGIVKRYPPVVAFRKGIRTHHFRKVVVPLEKTTGNVHLRMALKGVFENMGMFVGLTVCITVVVIAMNICFTLSSFFSDPDKMIQKTAGMDFSDLRVEIQRGVDIERLRQDILDLPEVRKVNPVSDIYTEYVKYVDIGQSGVVVAYDDFEKSELIVPDKGRVPKHDNEVMLTKVVATLLGKKTGDNIVLGVGNIKKTYVISGVIASTVNGGVNTYMTNEGYRRLNPTYEPTIIDVFLNDGVDADDFTKKLTELYGKTVVDLRDDDGEYSDYEDRVKATADRVMATMITTYGVDGVEYSIVVGDKMISGSSDKFRIKSITSLKKIAATQLLNTQKALSLGTRVFMIMAAIVISVIIAILVESSIKKLKKELGIMKALGYTSKELRFQVAFRTIPAVIIASLIGTGVAIFWFKVVYGMIMGAIPINLPGMLLIDLIIVMFSVVAGYFGTRKIKTISVTELVSAAE